MKRLKAAKENQGFHICKKNEPQGKFEKSLKYGKTAVMPDAISGMKVSKRKIIKHEPNIF